MNKNDAAEIAASITKVFSSRPFTVFAAADNGNEVSSNIAQLNQARQANEQKARNKQQGNNGRRFQASRKNAGYSSVPY